MSNEYVGIYGHIKKQRQQFIQVKPIIETKKKEVTQLESQLTTCTTRAHIRRRYDLQTEIAKRKKEIEELESNHGYTEFQEKIKPFLREHERCKDIFRMEDRMGKSFEPNPRSPIKKQIPSSSSSSTSSATATASKPGIMSFVQKRARTDRWVDAPNSAKRSKVVDDFLIIVQDHPPTIELLQEDTCPQCGGTMLLEVEQSILACTSGCGVTKKYIDATSNAVAYGEEVEFAAYSYQRINYFNEYLTTFQAKESNQVIQKDIDTVMQALWEARIRTKEQITLEKVREVVREKRMHHVYKQVTQIWCRITGKVPPRLAPDIEDKCRTMFKAIQEPFEMFCPPERKNFFSYSYCFYKFMQLLGYTSFLKHFALPKDKTKLADMDVTWEKICNHLDWQYVETKVDDV